MKHLFFTFLFLLSLSSTTAFADHGYTHEAISCSPVKIYLSPEQVFVSDNGIEVALNGIILSVPALHCEEGEIYINDLRTPPGTWLCPRCWHLNSLWHRECQNPDCDYPN